MRTLLRCTFRCIRDRIRPRCSASAFLQATLGLALIVLTAGACRNPLDVPDPNSISASDLNNAQSVPSLVNGALTNMNVALGALSALHGAASDELQYIGSHDAWGDLSAGHIGDPGNEFTNDYWPDATQARYMVDRSIDQAEEFREKLRDRTYLAHAYLQGAVVYAIIADMYDDFVIPEEPGEAAPPTGPSNMVQLYDQAISWLNDAERIASQLGDTNLVSRAIGYRARVRHAKAVWQMLNPPGSQPSDPLVGDQQVAEDARTALQRIGMQSDWSWDATFGPTTTGTNPIAADLTQRGDLQFGATLVETDQTQPTRVTGIAAIDPVTGEPSPVVERKVNEFYAAGPYPTLHILTARELHLLLAEYHLSQGNTEQFRSYINNVRALAGQPEFTGEVSDLKILQYSRKVHLLLMHRRLGDLYRFGLQSDRWLPQSAAVQQPGTFLPIPIDEVRNNPQVGGG